MTQVSKFGSGKNNGDKRNSGARVDIKALYKIGQVVAGRIISIFKAGSDHSDLSAAIQLESGATALLLYSEIPDYPRHKIADLYQRGDSVEAEIVALRPNKNRVTVSLRPVARRRTIEQLEPGYVVLGRIVSSVSYGYFVAIGGGIEALLHKENLETNHLNGEQSFDYDAEIEVAILDIAEDGRRVSVGRKQLFN